MKKLDKKKSGTKANPVPTVVETISVQNKYGTAALIFRQK
jgi:hypothetical protein